MVKVALFVQLKAKPGKEDQVATFLKSGLPLVQKEPATAAWFGIRLGPSTFGIFDAFPDEQGRQAHLMGRVAAALLDKAPELLAEPPVIQRADVLGAKLPGARFKLRTSASIVRGALAFASVVAAGWFAVKRISRPATPYEALQYEPVSTPL